MDPNYRYKGARLKPKIAKAIILELFAGKTVSRRDIDEGIIEHHQSHGGLPSIAKTSPIKAALRYLKDKGFAENVSKGSGSTWRIFEKPKPMSVPSNAQDLVVLIRSEIRYLTTQIESFEDRISELEATLIKNSQ
ncbi:hypothetical protein C6503_08815 [Candidatus Poribacteria bacterium]|nr:MAG: hypothetical protein C6503_08815 [Candidatus Poribacteria bacterium]